MEVPDEVYLGDGVYASHDGFHIWLDLRAQDPNIRIALEPAVQQAFVEYAEYCKLFFAAKKYHGALDQPEDDPPEAV